MRESAVHYPELIRGASIGFADFLLIDDNYPSIEQKYSNNVFDNIEQKSN
jgi:hypothetical protein